MKEQVPKAAVFVLIPMLIVAMGLSASGADAPGVKPGIKTDRKIYPEPELPKLPKAGGVFVDPTFGTRIMRVTDEGDGNNSHNAYSYWPTFNKDSTRFQINSGGRAMVYRFDPKAFKILGKEPLFPANTPSGSKPRWEDSIWSGTDPDVIFGHEGLNIWAWNVKTKKYTLVKNFAREFPEPKGTSVQQMTSSVDDQTFAFKLRGPGPKWAVLGYAVWRRDTDKLLINRKTVGGFDECQIDKTGRYLLIKERKGPIESAVIDLNTGRTRELTDAGPDFGPGHSDNGAGTVIGVENHRNRVLFRKMSSPHKFHVVLDLGRDWSQGKHISMLADDEKWTLVSFYTKKEGPGVFRREIIQAATDGSGEVRRLCHHQSVYKSYWDSPRANISRDGRFIVFTSNWGGSPRRDVFILEVPEEQEAKEGKMHFQDSFDKDLSNWTKEGKHLVEIKDGKLHMKTTPGGSNNGLYLWCKTKLPADFRIEYDFTPISKSGFFLIFFCAEGVKGEDILEPELFEKYMPQDSWKPWQDFDKYVSAPNRRTESRIRCYHISYRRNENANCNFRKNPGLNLLVSRKIDMILPKGKTSHLVLTKKKNRIKLMIDDKVFMDHLDDGTVAGPFYSGGRWGLRQVYDTDGVYENVKVYDLSETP